MNVLRQCGVKDVEGPVVMGILNCTPDSFFEGSRKQTEHDIAQRAEEIMRHGGSIIDVGAFSTRPGAAVVAPDEEMRRMRTALQTVRRTVGDVPLSIDTYRPEVARMAVEEYGAGIINDVSEGGRTGIVDPPLTDNAPQAAGMPAIFKEVARLGVAYVLMSVQLTMETLLDHFMKEVGQLQSLGVMNIILDPGYGFGKDVVDGNFQILKRQQEIRQMFPMLPLLVGVSRKRMIWQLLGCTAQDAPAMQGTMLVNLLALERGADILRVHDVTEAVHTIKVYRSLMR